MGQDVDQIRIGGRLRHARKIKGLSMKQVAEQVDCSESFISKLERDKVQLQPGRMKCLVGKAAPLLEVVDFHCASFAAGPRAASIVRKSRIPAHQEAQAGSPSRRRRHCKRKPPPKGGFTVLSP